MFAIEHDGVEPDFMVLAKALGGDLPMSAVIARRDIVKDLPPNSHVLTAAANHITAAVACTNLDLLQDGLVERAAALGDYAIAKLREIAKEREIIGDVRGKGLGIGVELVKNRETKKPIEPKQMMGILVKLRDRGVFDLPCGRYGNVIRVIPPLTITKNHLDKGLEILSEVLKEVEKDILE
jgi:4-aminobutyrate aminotransferase